MALEQLQHIPEGLQAAGTITQRIDSALARGFARLTPDLLDDLASVGRTLTGTPLGAVMDDTLEALKEGVRAEHLSVLAAARTALEGARYDGLMTQASEALGLALTDAQEVLPGTPIADDPLMDSVRQWLLEVALAGLLQLERATVGPFVAVLESIQERPEHVRLAALLTGFVTELLAHVPTAALDQIPQRRWADIWSRAMLMASQPVPVAASQPVRGTFAPIGVDVRLHDNLANAEVWGVLEDAEAQAHVVRASISAWKVDVVTGAEVWSTLANHAKGLLTLVDKGTDATVAKMALTSTGTLIWEDEQAKGGSAAPLLKTAAKALEGASHRRVLAFDRHPIQIAIPIWLEGCTVNTAGTTVTCQGATLPLAVQRLSPLGPPMESVRKAKQMVGVLRFDADRWCVQPLAVSGKGGVAPDLSKGLKGKGGNAAILTERASKLLRQKS